MVKIEAKKLASEALIIESSRTEFIQECHIMIGHCIYYCVEEELFFRDIYERKNTCNWWCWIFRINFMF